MAKCAMSSEEREKLATGHNDEELPGLDNADRYWKTSYSEIVVSFVVSIAFMGGALCHMITQCEWQSCGNESFSYSCKVPSYNKLRCCTC